LPDRDFPEGFLFGAATSAHQVEGGNSLSDWWAWELQGGSKDLSGDACDHYRRYRQDIELLREIGLSSYRFSVEWARIEPEEGRFDRSELEHYRDVAETCRSQGVEPIVTLHHFTLPLWLSRQGGVLAPQGARAFARYCGRAAEALAGRARWIVVINEPNILALMGYLQGVWPPGRRSTGMALRAARRLVTWYRTAAQAIRAVEPGALLGVAENWVDFAPLRESNLLHRLGSSLQDRAFNRWYLGQVRDQSDFIGINYYARQYATGLFRQVPLRESGQPRTEMGWSIEPQGLLRALTAARAQGLPLLVTENGTACADDGERGDYVVRHLAAVRDAIAAGADVRGYQYWSLLDNFEWAEGYRPKFGLVAVDRGTQVRTPRPSARLYGEIARTGRLPAPPAPTPDPEEVPACRRAT